MSTTSKDKYIFAVHDIIVHYRQLKSGMLQARMKRQGIELDAKGRTPLELKTKFVKAFDEALKQKEIDDAMVTPDNSPTFMEYAYKWLAIKKRTTKPSTYKEYDRQVDNVLFLKFADRKAASFTRDELQQYLSDEYVDTNKMRTAHKIHLTLRCIFDLIEDDLGIPSPMKKVIVPRYTSKHGRAFTYDEERLIPITPMLRRVMPYINFETAKNCNIEVVTSRLHSVFPNHHSHELRYTFITRCKESGVNLELVMMWD